MIRLGCCYVGDQPPAPLESYEALRDFGTSFARVTPDLAEMFPDSRTFLPRRTIVHLQHFANNRVTNYLNPSGGPEWATGGLPVFRAGIGGAAAWWLYTQAKLDPRTIRQVFRAAVAQNDPEFALKAVVPNIAGVHIAKFGAQYRMEQQRTWSRDDPLNATGEHAYGAKGHESADLITGPRDWMLKPETIPHADPDFYLNAGREIGEAFGPDLVQMHGIGNEFGNDMCWLPIRFDGANYKDGEDMVATRIMPEIVMQYLSGLLDVQPGAVTVLGEHDGTDIMRRFYQYERDNGIVLSDFVSWHPYPTSDPSRVSSYLAAARAAQDMRGQIISEIAGDEFADWLNKTLHDHPGLFAICALEQEWRGWFKDWQAGGKGLEMTEKGRDVQKVWREYNAKRRASRS